jgi:hypothetical protein
MATTTRDTSVDMQVSGTAEGVVVKEVLPEATFPYLLIRDEETGLLYPKLPEGVSSATGLPFASTNDTSDEECESPSSTRANTSDSSDEEWDEESLVHETFGRHTYNFGDTKLGPLYEKTSIFANRDYSEDDEDEYTEIDYE